jgi:nucleotide-binding universal stress UspA family protein
VADAPARILIGVDGSPDANKCFRAVAQRTWPKESEARVVLIPKPGPGIGLVTAAAVSTLDRDTPRPSGVSAIEQGVEELRASGLKASVSLREHLPLDVLIEEAREWSADCLFVDALGFSRRPGSSNDVPPLSNVVKALAIGAPCSVEIVRGYSLNQEYLRPAA